MIVDTGICCPLAQAFIRHASMLDSFKVLCVSYIPVISRCSWLMPAV